MITGFFFMCVKSFSYRNLAPKKKKKNVRELICSILDLAGPVVPL